MKIDLNQFKGTLPYASELFGIYQSLLGWSSKMTENHLTRREGSVVRSLTERAISRVRGDVVVSPADSSFTVDNLQLPEVTSTRFVPRVAAEINSLVARLVAARLPVETKPTPAAWRQELTRETLNVQLKLANGIVEAWYGQFTASTPSPAADPELLGYVVEFSRKLLEHVEVPQYEVVKALLDREVSIAAYLNWLSVQKPDLLDSLFYRRVTDPFQDILVYDQDPLSTVGENQLEAVLSPIGLVHLFRQFFFEFDTFLGSPVGHVWLSPGSTLELVEETVRRTMTERAFESLIDTTDKSEKALTIHDELSTAIREENKSDLKFGFGASVNYHNGTLDAGTHADLSLDNSRSSAREITRKQMREQSERLSSEIRRSFKSNFKTVVETTDTSSRRYVLQNTTNSLVNYELRRKMRQVGVQVQDIGTRLCWQVFVDDPGKVLGVAKLLHIAQPPDLASLHAPDPPVRLEPKTVEVNLQFPYMRDPSSEGDGETDVLYIDGDDQEHIGGIHNIGYNDRIFYKKQYPLTPPAAGYTLSNQFSLQTHHPGTVAAEVQLVPGGQGVEVTMHQVNFKDQPSVELQLTTIWLPDSAQQKTIDDAYSKALATYDSQKLTLERAAFLAAARERIKLASQIVKRRFEDLREEERIAVYRRLIGQLMSVGDNLRLDEHVTSELIRAIFDVDEMLYFVAPDWWRPRSHQQGNLLAATPVPEIITDKDVVGWEGPMAAGRNNNYLITEESDPARMGSSLGWLLELDGDDLRNAFLNSPWVKAIVPIRPGKEEAAINWLSQAHVAGADGLDAAYDAPPDELKKIVDGLAEIGREAQDPVTLHDALLYLGNQVKKDYKEATTARPSPFDPTKNVIPTETVFEHGFDPLESGFEVNLDPTKVFSQWIQVLATDQVAAVEYDASKHI